ncbi:MAG TPA: hypothetical protein DDY59_08005 [Lachnospiraceae bacterium]|nr:hypothetical protein [Lachnospiraceae bacterium]
MYLCHSCRRFLHIT